MADSYFLIPIEALQNKHTKAHSVSNGYKYEMTCKFELKKNFIQV